MISLSSRTTRTTHESNRLGKTSFVSLKTRGSADNLRPLQAFAAQWLVADAQPNDALFFHCTLGSRRVEHTTHLSRQTLATAHMLKIPKEMSMTAEMKVRTHNSRKSANSYQFSSYLPSTVLKCINPFINVEASPSRWTIQQLACWSTM